MVPQSVTQVPIAILAQLIERSDAKLVQKSATIRRFRLRLLAQGLWCTHIELHTDLFLFRIIFCSVMVTVYSLEIVWNSLLFCDRVGWVWWVGFRVSG